MLLLFVLSQILLQLISCKDLPKGVMGMYLLTADDSVPNYTSTDTWTPNVYDYQIKGTNVMFLTFVNPQLMPAIPPAMSTLAKCKGQTGCPPNGTIVMFSIGGEAYSNKQWPWLASTSAAETMAAEVAQWDTKYGCDGIDLDIETGAGNSQSASDALVAFAKKVRSLNPNLYITQPVYGFPQVTAENTMVNQGFTKDGQSNDLVDAIGIMEYNGEESLQYVKDYGNATSQWSGFPITSDVPYGDILCGIQGSAGASTVTKMGSDIKSRRLGGIMVWFASIYDKTRGKAAFKYGGGGMDASNDKSSSWATAMATMNS